LLLFGSAFSGRLDAAITYGGDSTIVNMGNGSTGATSTLTLGSSGANAILIVILEAGGNFTGGSPAVSYNAVGLTPIGAVFAVGSAYYQVYYTTNLTSGKTLSITSSGGSSLDGNGGWGWSYNWFTYNGVSASSPIGTTALGSTHSATGSSNATVTASFSFTPSVSNSTIVQYSVMFGNTCWNTYGTGFGTVRGSTSFYDDGMAVGYGLSDYTPGSSSAYTLSQSFIPQYCSETIYAWGIELLPAVANSPTITPTFSVSPTFTTSPTPSNTLTATNTFTFSPTITLTSTPSNTLTVTNTFTFSPTITPSVTPSNTLTVTNTFTTSPTPTYTMVASNTSTTSPTPTGTPTRTASPTITSTATPTSTLTVTNTFTFSPTLTNTPVPTATSTVTPAFQLTKTSNVATANLGDTITYTISWKNYDPVSSQTMIIWDTVASQLTYLGASPAPTSYLGGVLMWNLGPQASGASGTITFWGVVVGYPWWPDLKAQVALLDAKLRAMARRHSLAGGRS